MVPCVPIIDNYSLELHETLTVFKFTLLVEGMGPKCPNTFFSPIKYLCAHIL